MRAERGRDEDVTGLPGVPWEREGKREKRPGGKDKDCVKRGEERRGEYKRKGLEGV